MAGDTLRGIGKKQLAEALEGSPEGSQGSESAQGSTEAETSGHREGTAAREATADIDIEEARPVRSLDDLPSDRTTRPGSEGTAMALGVSAAEMASAVTRAATPAPHSTTMLGAPAPEVVATVPSNSHAVPLGPSHTLLHAGSGAAAPSVAPAAIAADIAPIDDAVPLGTQPTTRSGPNRVSFGTMIGHEMHAVQARVAAAIAEADSSARGTAHGRDVHLPVSPAMLAERDPEPVAAPGVIPMAEPSGSSAGVGAAAVQAAAISSPGLAASATGSHDAVNEFSGGDHTFFETLPINDEYEPENPRGRLYTRLAVSGAVVAVVAVIVFAVVNSHSNAEEPPPVEYKTVAQPVAPHAPAPVAAAPARPAAPTPRNNEPAPTSTIPSSMPEAPAPVVAAPPAGAAHAARPQPSAVAAVAQSPAKEGKEPKVAKESKAPDIAPPAPAREEHKPAAVAARETKPAAAAATPKPAAEPAKPAAEPAPKPAALAAKPAEPAPSPKATPAPTHAREPARPAASAPKVAASPAARAPRPETPARPVARPSAPAASRNQKGTAAKPKSKYDPDGTLPLSFD